MCKFYHCNVAASENYHFALHNTRTHIHAHAHTHTPPASGYYNGQSQIYCGKATNYSKNKHWEFIHLYESTEKKKKAKNP